MKRISLPGCGATSFTATAPTRIAELGRQPAMTYLYQALDEKVSAWRTANYPCEDYPAIREILEFATEDAETAQLRYLRRAQFRALETYWYLRLVLQTPKIPDLYEKLFPKPKDRREAMGLTHPDIVSFIADEGMEACIERVLSDNA